MGYAKDEEWVEKLIPWIVKGHAAQQPTKYVHWKVGELVEAKQVSPDSVKVEFEYLPELFESETCSTTN